MRKDCGTKVVPNWNKERQEVWNHIESEKRAFKMFQDTID